MKSDDDARGGATRPHLDAKQCELLIALACNSAKPPSAVESGAQPKALPNPETTFGRAHRDSLAEAMIDLILGPDAA
jgi:hypothetical protein